jgi:hypothetical protein
MFWLEWWGFNALVKDLEPKLNEIGGLVKVLEHVIRERLRARALPTAEQKE